VDREKDTGKDSNRPSAYIGAVIFNAIFLYVLNRLPDWNVPLLTEAFRDVLWAINLSLIVQIVGNFALIFHHPLILHHQAHIAFHTVSVVAIYTLYRAFPFDFSPIPIAWFGIFFRVVLIFALISTIVSGVVHLVKMLRLLFLPPREH
jgi:hypothetical protein